MDAPELKNGRTSDDESAGNATSARVLRDPHAPDPDRDARWAAWRRDNAGAIKAYNQWFEREGHSYLRPPPF